MLAVAPLIHTGGVLMEAVITDSGFAQAINGRRFAEPMKAALLAVLHGDSYRIAADKCGLDHRDVHRAAKKVPGLREAHLRAWGESWGAALPEMWEHHLQGLRKC